MNYAAMHCEIVLKTIEMRIFVVHPHSQIILYVNLCSSI
jgi:hypothetical protein